MNGYRRLHREFPEREFYFVHTSREVLDIEERRWIGIRGHDRFLEAVSAGLADSKAGRLIDDATLAEEIEAEFGS